MATYGKTEEFEQSFERWDNCIERVNEIFIANGINDNIKKKTILLSSCGAKTYQVLRGLPNNRPSMKTDTQLVTLMKNHLYPALNVIAEWFKFNTHDRQTSETVAESVAVLRRLSEHCDYGDIKDVRIQQRLLSEKILTLKQTLTIVYSMESAATYSKSIADHQTLNSITDKINKILKVQPKTFEKKCYWCGGTKHTAQNCPFKEVECFYCHRKGHTLQAYQTKAANEGRDKRIPNRQRPVKTIETIDGNEEDEIFDLYTLHERKVQPFAESLKLEGNIVPMEIDTGASITVIGEQTFKIILPPVQPNRVIWNWKSFQVK